MLACDQSTLIVDRVAVRIIGALTEDRTLARGFDEPHHAIVRNVRPDEIAACREPGRTFSPARARPQALDTHVSREASLEARIEDDDIRSLDLTIPHRNPRLSSLRLRVPRDIATSAIFPLLDLISIRCVFIRLVRVA